jgi:ABC-type glycerol-3-phosphate transport system substrate-binding protein
MKTRTLLSLLSLALVLAACGANSPTVAPERPAREGGSLGPGHDTTPDSVSTVNRGGSYGSGH